MLRKLLRQRGVAMTCGFLTGLTIFGSILLYLILSLWLERFAAVNVLIAAIIPAILVPLLSCSLLRIVSKLESAEKKFQNSEGRFKSLYENATIGLYRTAPGGRILFANPALVEMLGYASFEELALRNLEEEGYEPDHPRRKFKDLVEKDGLVKGLEATWRRKDGSQIIVRESARAIRTEEDGILYYEGTVEDITEHRKAVDALRHRVELERLVSELSTLFINPTAGEPDKVIEEGLKLVGDFSKADRSYVFVLDREKGSMFNSHEWCRKGVEPQLDNLQDVPIPDFPWWMGRLEKGETIFIPNVEELPEEAATEKDILMSQNIKALITVPMAYDLNNILSGIVSYPELLLMDLPHDSPLRKSILAIQKSGERAAGIVQDLLTLARRGVATTEVVNLNQIVRDYLNSPEHERLQGVYEGIGMVTDLEPDLLNTLGSTIHLSKSLMNLVTNAAEAMPGGGTIRITTKNRYVDRPIGGYDSVEEGDYVLLSVSDRGIGISRMDLDRIFEPFYTKKAMGRSGTGLGMAVVWGTVKDHRGYIDIQSSQGKGSIFTLYLPVTRRESPSGKSPLPIERFEGREESILVVDDVDEQREIASGILGKLNYTVTAVSSGEEALEYLKVQSVDLVVLDMIMDPGMDGLETYRKILELHPEQRAIIVSGFSETARVKEAQQLGAGAYIRKPYLMEKIGMAVRTELDK